MIDEVFSAARSGGTEALKRLLEQNSAWANTENRDGLTPLGFAAHYGQADAVRMLLEYGAAVNALSHSKISFIPSNTALHAAIAGERSMEVVKLLLAHRARTDIFDSNGHTCLHTAAFHDDNVEMMKLLIANGADVHAKVEGGDTALALAREKGNIRVAELLMKEGAAG